MCDFRDRKGILAELTHCGYKARKPMRLLICLDPFYQFIVVINKFNNFHRFPPFSITLYYIYISL